MSKNEKSVARRAPANLSGTVEHGENVKDTIESLIVAFILAFVFRGFLVEAFVIPTGSMAPTLYGEHGSQMCPDCGWEYAYGMPQTDPYPKQIKCPNCGRVSNSHLEIPYHGPDNGCDLYDERHDPLLASKDPELAEAIKHLDFLPQSGDRILVFKWPYDLGGEFLGPRPWDVVVFKNPAHQGDNYIKRLIGVPNEVLEIIDGDIYACSVDQLAPETVSKMEQVVELKYHLRPHYRANSRMGREMYRLQRQITEEISDHLRIRRKTDIAQKSLWQVVFRQDFLPEGVEYRSSAPHWQAQDTNSQWATTEPVVHFDGRQSPRQKIRFVGKGTGDFYAYNHKGATNDPLVPVHDLRMKFVLDYRAGQGLLELGLSKGLDLFTVQLKPDGEIMLQRTQLDPRTRAPAGSAQYVKAVHIPPWEAGRPFELEFANVDYQVSLKVNGQVTPVLVTDEYDYYPDIRALRDDLRALDQPLIEIAARELDFQLWHLSLDRDVYYRESGSDNGHPGWGTRGNPIYLREGEYFVLGDNSPASQDSRLWSKPGRYLNQCRGMDYQVGTVTHDQLIGRAFFVYWPMGYRIRWLPVLKGFGLVPNVGKMRWIR